MALRYERRLLQKSEINLGREGTTQAANFPELRNEIVALKKLEQEQKEVALRIAQIEDGIRKIEEDRQRNAQEQSDAVAKLEAEEKPIVLRRDEAKRWADVCDRELSQVEGRSEGGGPSDSDPRGTQESSVSQYRTTSRLAGNCSAERASAPHGSAAPPRRRRPPPPAHDRARPLVQPDRQTGAAQILLQCGF